MTREHETPEEQANSYYFGLEVTQEQLDKHRNPNPTKPIRPDRKGENEKVHIRKDGKK